MATASPVAESPSLRPGRGVRLIALFRSDIVLAMSVGVLILLAILAVMAPIIAPADPARLFPLERLQAPSATHLLGTDQHGRDILSRLIHGARISLSVGIAAALLCSVVGLVLGLLAGFVRWLDMILMRVMDGLMAIPGILLAITLASLSSASIASVIIAIVVPETPRVVRLARSVVLSVRERQHVEAALVIGTPLPALLRRHVMPFVLQPLLVQAVGICSAAVMIEASLSFLGAGAPPTSSSWGIMISDSRTYFRVAPWLILFPGLMLATTILAINVAGERLRRHADPHQVLGR